MQEKIDAEADMLRKELMDDGLGVLLEEPAAQAIRLLSPLLSSLALTSFLQEVPWVEGTQGVPPSPVPRQSCTAPKG